MHPFESLILFFIDNHKMTLRPDGLTVPLTVEEDEALAKIDATAEEPTTVLHDELCEDDYSTTVILSRREGYNAVTVIKKEWK